MNHYQENKDAICGRLVHVRGSEPQSSFAQKLGVGKTTLGNYERGERELSNHALIAYAQLGWNIHWILTGEGSQLYVHDPKAISILSKHNPSDLFAVTRSVEEAMKKFYMTNSDKWELISYCYNLVQVGYESNNIVDIATARARRLSNHEAFGEKTELDSVVKSSSGQYDQSKFLNASSLISAGGIFNDLLEPGWTSNNKMFPALIECYEGFESKASIQDIRNKMTVIIRMHKTQERIRLDAHREKLRGFGDALLKSAE